MAEERIAERIDANLLDITLDSLRELPKEAYDKKIANLKQNAKGKLIIKEYPTATANVNHFRVLLDELNLKKKFKPDMIVIDYLNICASSRMKPGANVNSYTFIKAIAENFVVLQPSVVFQSGLPHRLIVSDLPAQISVWKTLPNRLVCLQPPTSCLL